MSTNPKQRETI